MYRANNASLNYVAILRHDKYAWRTNLRGLLHFLDERNYNTPNQNLGELMAWHI